MGLPYWSLSKYLKGKVKRAVSYVGDFEVAVAREASKRGAQGVVCGHIHHGHCCGLAPAARPCGRAPWRGSCR